MMDTFGHSRPMTLQRWSWLIGRSSASDNVLMEWAQSYSAPPSLKLSGARLDFPSYSQERRAMRLVAESSSIEIDVKPSTHSVNPVFELDGAPKELLSVAINDGQLAADAYAWDGSTLWMRASIGSTGAKISLRFR